MVETIDVQERKLGGRCCDEDLSVRMEPAEAVRLSDDLQILAHPVRLQILDLLARHAGQVCVCDLEGALPIKQPTVSHHLRLLREAGLVDSERHGLWAYYFVKHDSLAALRTQISAQLAAWGRAEK